MVKEEILFQTNEEENNKKKKLKQKKHATTNITVFRDLGQLNTVLVRQKKRTPKSSVYGTKKIKSNKLFIVANNQNVNARKIQNHVLNKRKNKLDVIFFIVFDFDFQGVFCIVSGVFEHLFRNWKPIWITKNGRGREWLLSVFVLFQEGKWSGHEVMLGNFMFSLQPKQENRFRNI